MTSYLPSVLVLLASHNGERWLEAQLESILKQEGVHATINIRDDSSNDATVQIIDRFVKRDSRVNRILDNHLAGSAAGNFFQLIRQADIKGYDFIALSDQDDFWLANKLERAVSQLKLTAAQGYSAAVAAVWSDGRKAILRQNASITECDYLFEGAGQGCTFVLTSAWAKSLQNTLNSPDVSEILPTVHYHDWALYALTRAKGQRWIFDDHVVMLYRQHEKNDTGARTSSDGILLRIERIRSGWYKNQVEAICRLVEHSQSRTRSAAKWLDLVEKQINRPNLRLIKCWIVMTAGRRRWTDRIIQVMAVLINRL